MLAAFQGDISCQVYYAHILAIFDICNPVVCFTVMNFFLSLVQRRHFCKVYYARVLASFEIYHPSVHLIVLQAFCSVCSMSSVDVSRWYTTLVFSRFWNILSMNIKQSEQTKSDRICFIPLTLNFPVAPVICLFLFSFFSERSGTGVPPLIVCLMRPSESIVLPPKSQRAPHMIRISDK